MDRINGASSLIFSKVEVNLYHTMFKITERKIQTFLLGIYDKQQLIKIHYYNISDVRKKEIARKTMQLFCNH